MEHVIKTFFIRSSFTHSSPGTFVVHLGEELLLLSDFRDRNFPESSLFVLHFGFIFLMSNLCINQNPVTDFFREASSSLPFNSGKIASEIMNRYLFL